MALSVLGASPASEAGPAGSDQTAADPGSSPSSAQPRLDGPRRLEIVKTNLCRPPSPLGLVFEGDDVPVPTLRYTEYAEPAPQPTRIDLCAGWLFSYLQSAGEPVRPADVVRAARQAGYNRRLLYRARQILGSFIVDLGTAPNDPRKRWTLAAPAPGNRPST